MIKRVKGPIQSDVRTWVGAKVRFREDAEVFEVFVIRRVEEENGGVFRITGSHGGIFSLKLIDGQDARGRAEFDLILL